jgi:hypothetical protein
VFAFGTGLSYTTFSLAIVEVPDDGDDDDDHSEGAAADHGSYIHRVNGIYLELAFAKVAAASKAALARPHLAPVVMELAVHVENTGDVAGATVVMVYLQGPQHGVERFDPTRSTGTAGVSTGPNSTATTGRGTNTTGAKTEDGFRSIVDAISGTGTVPQTVGSTSTRVSAQSGAKSLRRFQKVWLEPGQSKTVVLGITAYDFARATASGTMLVDRGVWFATVGADVEAPTQPIHLV